MANFVNQHNFNEMLVWETTIIMLKKPERDLAYVLRHLRILSRQSSLAKMTAKLVYTFSKVKLRLLLDLVLNVSKLDLRDQGTLFVAPKH